jgi:circadian clock protein KaiB
MALSDLCAGLLAGRANLEVIDVRREPERGEAANVIGLPTLVKVRPLPTRRVVGDLSHGRRVLSALGIDVASTDG